jgi:aldehyde:ferredoxin oxidoreductase
MKTETKILKIDLSNGTSEVVVNLDLSLEEKLGGFGSAISAHERNLYSNPDLVDAFDERNNLRFDIGFTTGSRLMTSRRTTVSGLSPLKTCKKGNNGVMYSSASGDLGVAIRRVGLDGIEIVGKSSSPMYLVVDGENVQLFDASAFEGKSTHKKILMLAEKCPDAAYATVGLAAENGVRFAGIAFSTYDQIKNGTRNMRFAGRGGFGAVLADKGILGVVVRGGNDNVDLGNVKDWNVEVASGSKTRKYRELGTFFSNIESADGLKVGIHDNFSVGRDERTSRLHRRSLLEQGCSVVDKGCLGCGVKCWKEIRKGSEILGKIDYEPGSLLGPNIGIYDIEEVMKLIEMVDGYGMDSMSTGVCLGFEMQRTGKFGDFGFAKKLIRQIAHGHHPLKDGVFRVAGNDPSAMHVKGIEFAAYIGNLNPGYAFAIGGGHMTMDTYNGWCFQDANGRATNSVDEWVENIIRGPQIILYDMNGICKFAKVNFDQVAELVRRVYGDSVNADELRDVSKLVNYRVMLLDKSRGFCSEDEVLPLSCHRDMGFVIPHFNTLEFFDAVKKGVYARYDSMERDYRARELI